MIFSGALAVRAQAVRLGDKEYIQRVWRTEEGLPQNTVTSIVQTRDGYIWVGTFGGLARFDGIRFTLFTSSNTPELKSNRVVNLLEDRAGALWIISEHGTLARYANGRFSDYTSREEMPAGDIHCVLTDSQGALWVGTHLQGMLRFESGRLVKRYTTENGLPANFVNAITEDRAGNLWVGTQGGLVRISQGQLIAYTTQNGLPYNNISNLIESRDGSLWVVCLGNVTIGGRVVAESRILHYQDGAFTQIEGSFGGIAHTLRSFYEDLDGTLWIAGYNSGLHQWKDGRQSSFTMKEGLENEFVRTVVFIHEDRQGALWLGSTGGLSRFKDGKYTNYTTAEGLSHNFVRAIHEEQDGTFWLGTYGGGLNRFRDGRFVHITAKDGLAEDIVSRILTDDDGNFWLSGNRGIYRVRRQELNDFADGKIRAVNPVSYGVADVVLTLSRPLVAGKSLQLVNEIPPDLPLAEADENRVQQILYNLVGNAIKFTPSGAVTVSARPIDGFVEVTVADTGIGIPADKHAVIFESFEQVDATMTREYGGTGLGLAVTRQLVELHGGGIRVESEVGEGSRFIFTLPASSETKATTPATGDGQPGLARVEFAAPVELEAAAPEAALNGAARILVVDDEPINIQVLKNHLALEHYAVITALNGHDALAALGNEPQPDLVLLDVMMPGLSGYEVCERIRARHSADELPVIILTAKNQVADLVAGLTSGANDFLAKPISRDELLSRIRTHLSLAAANRELREARDRLEIKVRERTEELRQSNTQLQGANEQLTGLNEQLAVVNQQLGRANENLLAALNLLRVGAVMTGADGRVMFLSQAAEALFDRSQGEAMGMTWESLFPIQPHEQEKLKAMTALPAKQRSRLLVSFQSNSGQSGGRRYSTEIEVQDDPRAASRRLFFLYDVSEIYDLRRLLDERAKFHDLVGESAAMLIVFKQIRDIARMDSTCSSKVKPVRARNSWRAPFTTTAPAKTSPSSPSTARG